MAPSSFVPKLQLHKATGQAFVRLHRSQKPRYLGKFGTAEAEAAYYRAIAEWRLGQTVPDVSPDERTIAELVVAFWKHAQTYYRDADGKPTAELPCLKAAIQPLLDLYQSVPCSQFGPKALKVVRQRMIDQDWSRTNVKAQPIRAPSGAFNVQAYGRAVTRACDQAFPLPPDLARDAPTSGRPETMASWKARLGSQRWGAAERWLREHRFSPNRLRHSAATLLRAKHGIDVAQTFLGHKIGSTITEIYAEANIQEAIRVAKVAG